MAPSNRFEMRVDEDWLERVDAWRAEQQDVPTRAEAVRRLADLGLASQSKEELRFSEGEKLMLFMMRDLQQLLTQGKPPETDPDFIFKALAGGHHWAIEWRMSGILRTPTDKREDLRLVVDVLDMWNFIEEGYERLSPADKNRLAAEVPIFGENPRFHGFDGNNETDHYAIAGFLIDEMQRFTRFAGRDLNSHSPSVWRYRRMCKAFEPMRAGLVGHSLSVDQIATILLAASPPVPVDEFHKLAPAVARPASQQPFKVGSGSGKPTK